MVYERNNHNNFNPFEAGDSGSAWHVIHLRWLRVHQTKDLKIELSKFKHPAWQTIDVNLHEMRNKQHEYHYDDPNVHFLHIIEGPTWKRRREPEAEKDEDRKQTYHDMSHSRDNSGSNYSLDHVRDSSPAREQSLSRHVERILIWLTEVLIPPAGIFKYETDLNVRAPANPMSFRIAGMTHTTEPDIFWHIGNDRNYVGILFEIKRTHTTQSQTVQEETYLAQEVAHMLALIYQKRNSTRYAHDDDGRNIAYCVSWRGKTARISQLKPDKYFWQRVRSPHSIEEESKKRDWNLPVRQTKRYELENRDEKVKFLNELMGIIYEELKGCSWTKNDEARKFYYWWYHGQIVA